MTRTVVAEAYGGPEVLALPRHRTARSGAGQVLVDVRAAGTNPIDFKLYSGDMGRDAANLPMPLGMEVAGVVVAAAPGVAGYTGPLTVGDEVIAARRCTAATPSGSSPTPRTWGTSRRR